VLVRTGTLMLYRLVLWVRSPVGTAWKVGMAGGGASPVAERPFFSFFGIIFLVIKK